MDIQATLVYATLRQLPKSRFVAKANRVTALKVVPWPTWVFHHKGRPFRNIYKVWRAACIRAGLEGKTIHDFRRTAVRNLERAGVPRLIAMKLTGHKTESIS